MIIRSISLIQSAAFRHLRYSLAFLTLLLVGGTLSAEVILQDDFLDQTPDQAPGVLWSAVEGGGSILVRQDYDEIFGEGTTNQYLEWMSETTSGPMRLRASTGENEGVVSISFDFIQPSDFSYYDYSWIILHAGGTATDDRAQVITFGYGTNKIGTTAEYQFGVVQHIELIVNNRNENVVYGDGQDLESGTVDIWINGTLAQKNFTSQNNTKGPITHFELSMSGSKQQKLLFNNILIEAITYEEEVIQDDIVFDETFDEQTISTSPGTPWTGVIDGIGIGAIQVEQDLENIFDKGTGNQYLSYHKNNTASSGALRADQVISAPVATFSLRFIEPEIEGYDNDDYTWLIIYAGSRATPNRAQLLTFSSRGGSIGSTTTYEKGVVNQLDLVVNNSDDPVTYAESHIVAPGTVDIWLNGVLTESGFSAHNTKRGPIEGFELNTRGGGRGLYLFDEFLIRNFAYVTDQEQSEDGFALWQSGHFSSEELEDPTISGPLADPVGDGVANLLAYALHLDPRSPAPRDALPTQGFTEEGLTLTFNRSKEATDVEFVVEVSEDLVTWSAAPEDVEQIGLTDNGETDRAVFLDKGTGDRRFIRLRLEN